MYVIVVDAACLSGPRIMYAGMYGEMPTKNTKDLVYHPIAKSTQRLRGAMVARLTPDQKAACSNHVGVTSFSSFFAL